MTSMSQYLQVTQQYISHKDRADYDLACTAGKEEMEHITPAAVNRKIERASRMGAKGRRDFKQTRRRTLKTFATMMQTNNMIAGNTNINISKFHIPKDEAGNFVADPWDSFVELQELNSMWYVIIIDKLEPEIEQLVPFR